MRPSAVEETRYGFAWGNAMVERVASDGRIGWVLRVWARRDDGRLGAYVDVRVSPGGRMIEALEPGPVLT